MSSIVRCGVARVVAQRDDGDRIKSAVPRENRLTVGLCNLALASPLVRHCLQASQPLAGHDQAAVMPLAMPARLANLCCPAQPQSEPQSGAH